MLDVHAPEHGIHGARDFFVHLLTITAGLLIAIALEQSVEAVHHRYQRKEAEAMIRQELRENRDELMQRQATLKSETDDLVGLLAYIDERLAHKPADASKLHVALSEGPLRDAAWRSAAATGVAAYMDYATVEKFAECYKEQDQYELLQEHTMEAYLNIESFAAVKRPADLDDENLRASQPVIRQELAYIGAMRDLGGGTLQMYDIALK